jgi:hypothetical protein
MDRAVGGGRDRSRSIQLRIVNGHFFRRRSWAAICIGFGGEATQVGALEISLFDRTTVLFIRQPAII